MAFSFRIYFSVALCALILAGCASQQLEAQNQQQDQVVNSYKRSRQVLSGPFPNGDYGVISDSRLSISLTEGLLTAQAVQHCDAKPVIIVHTPPVDRVRTKENNYLLPECTTSGARRSGVADQFLQPYIDGLKCKVAVSAYEDKLPKPTRTIEQRQDCYQTAPSREVFGRLRLHIVKEGVGQNSIAQSPVVATLDASGGDKRATLDISSVNLKKDECLAFTDAAGTPVPIRSTGDKYLFASAGMRATKTLLEAEDKVRSAESLLTSRKASLQSSVQIARADTSLKDGVCTKPAMRPFPAKPNGMSVETAWQHAAAYCVLTLTSRQRSDRVVNALIGTGNLSYVQAFRKIGINVSSCTQGGYQFDNDTTLINRLFDAFIPLEQQQGELAGMIQSCTSSVTRRCAPEHFAWESEIERIKSEPDTLFNGCKGKVSLVQDTMNSVKQSEEILNTSKSELASLKQNIPQPAAQATPLSASYCRARS
jgi:hypothetical protein